MLFAIIKSKKKARGVIMSKSKKKAAWIIVCMLWGIVVVGIHIIMRGNFKFPVLDFSFLGWLVPVFMCLPFVSLFLGVICVNKNKVIKAFTMLFTAIGILAYVGFMCFATLGFSAFNAEMYPVKSHTENMTNYLVLDDGCKENYSNIVKVMPEKIPSNAQNVTYVYEYDPRTNVEIDSYWELPKDEYEQFKNETLKNEKNSEQNGTSTSFTASWQENKSGFVMNSYMTIRFDDEKCSVKCSLYQNQNVN